MAGKGLPYDGIVYLHRDITSHGSGGIDAASVEFVGNDVVHLDSNIASYFFIPTRSVMVESATTGKESGGSGVGVGQGHEVAREVEVVVFATCHDDRATIGLFCIIFIRIAALPEEWEVEVTSQLEVEGFVKK